MSENFWRGGENNGFLWEIWIYINDIVCSIINHLLLVLIHLNDIMNKKPFQNKLLSPHWKKKPSLNSPSPTYTQLITKWIFLHTKIKKKLCNSAWRQPSLKNFIDNNENATENWTFQFSVNWCTSSDCSEHFPLQYRFQCCFCTTHFNTIALFVINLLEQHTFVIVFWKMRDMREMFHAVFILARVPLLMLFIHTHTHTIVGGGLEMTLRSHFFLRK